MSDKKSKKGSQGSPLPADGSPLGVYPVGSCVQIEIDGTAEWYMIVCRLAGNDNPHLRKMLHPPFSLDWNVGPSHAQEFKSCLVVVHSAWPRRTTDERGLNGDSDVDPMVVNLRLDSPGDQSSASDGGDAP